jgi:hypothetical protein
MELESTSGHTLSCELDTPNVSIFVPSPAGDDPADFSRKIPMNEDGVSYSGLRLERFVIHQGRFGSSQDTSLLEAIVESAFDEFKSVRVVADGGESVHAFVRALSEEFLNCGEAVHVDQVIVRSPDESTYVCTLSSIYPNVPRFRHLAQGYTGRAVSHRSVLEASLSAACDVVGQILLTFQAEGFELPSPPIKQGNSEIKEISPLPSTIDSPQNQNVNRGSSLFHPIFLGDTRARSHRRRGPNIFTRLFTCGGKN